MQDDMFTEAMAFPDADVTAVLKARGYCAKTFRECWVAQGSRGDFIQCVGGDGNIIKTRDVARAVVWHSPDEPLGIWAHYGWHLVRLDSVPAHGGAWGRDSEWCDFIKYAQRTVSDVVAVAGGGAS